MLSTVFLWMVDVDKSREECAQFVLAEGRRQAFKTVRLDLQATDEPDNSK